MVFFGGGFLDMDYRMSYRAHLRENNRLIFTPFADDWQFERGSTTFFVGDLIRFEVSIIMGHHIPLRVYVDHYVATTTPDAEAALRYDFNEHYGWAVTVYFAAALKYTVVSVSYKLVFVSTDVLLMLSWQTPIFISCQELRSTSWGSS